MVDYKKQACPRNIAKETQLTARKKSLFDASAKIGKLEFLNDFGMAGGNVRKGLEQLAVVSDTVRVGKTTTDTTSYLDDTGQGLMEGMGLGKETQSAVEQFDPNAVNGAVGASKALVARAKQGNFRMEDIAMAAGEFKNIALIANKIFKPGQEAEPVTNWQKFKCRPSPYAMDLVHKAPKQNYNFVVEIELNPAYKNQFELNQIDDVRRTSVRPRAKSEEEKHTTNTAETNSQLSIQLAFLVKDTGRPSVTYEYEELNYYNYRTKGIRKAMFNPISMNFIDDQLNSAAAFYAFYISAMSPIVNMGIDRKAATGVAKNYEQSGMDFSDYRSKEKNTTGKPNTYPAHAATVGALRPVSIGESNNTKNIIDRISVYQFGKNARTLTAYNMYFPRIMSFNPSNADMASSGEGQSLSMEIDYDYFTILPEMDIFKTDSLISPNELAGMTGGDAGGFFPIKHFVADNESGQRAGQQPDRNSFLTRAGSLLGLGDD